MQQIDTLLHPQNILLEKQILAHHSIVMNAGKIIAIVPSSQAKKDYAAKQEYTLASHLVMPGLVNAHTHVSMNLLRGLADDLSLHPWLQKHIWPAEAAAISPEFVKDGALLAMAELLRGGVTCFNDDYFYVEERAKVVDKVGMRAVLSECLVKFPTLWSPSTEVAFDRTEAMIDFCKNARTVHPAVFPHAPYSTDLALLKKVGTFIQKHDVLLHTHMQESQSEIDDYLNEHGKRPLSLWQDYGLIGQKTILAHMTHVNEGDLDLVKAAGASVVHCPESNMKLASKIAPVQKMLDMGINVALGTDGAASNNDLDMFGEMKSAAFLSKVSTDNPESLPAQTVVDMATINGAKALHLDHLIGSISVGKVADLIAIDFNSVETEPCYALIPQLVYNVPRHNVTHVWVNGKILLDNRELTTIDMDAVRHKTKIWQEKLKQYAKI